MISKLNLEAYPKMMTLRDGTQVEVRPLEEGDNVRLLNFFEQIGGQDLWYLKDDVTNPQVIRDWTVNINFDRVIPIEAVVGDEIVADATLHRSQVFARRHVGELRIVVDPRYRRRGLGRLLIRELVDIAIGLELYKVTFELVPEREEAAIKAAESMGFSKVATLKGRIRDYEGGYDDLVVLEMSLSDRETWWRY